MADERNSRPGAVLDETPSHAVLMGLGDFRFSLPTAAHDNLSRATAWRWEAVDRIGRAPALQYAGPGEDSITLSGVVFPAWAGAGLGQVDAMRAEAGKGAPLMLVDGRGAVFGRWVITSVTEDQTAFLAGGVPRKQAWTIRLLAYGDDRS